MISGSVNSGILGSGALGLCGLVCLRASGLEPEVHGMLDLPRQPGAIPSLQSLDPKQPRAILSAELGNISDPQTLNPKPIHGI